MAAEEDQPELIVAERIVGRVVTIGDGREVDGRVELGADARGEVGEPLVAAQRIECLASRDLQQPRRGIGRHAARRPVADRADERLLHHVLGQREMRRPEQAGEERDESACFLAEEAVD